MKVRIKQKIHRDAEQDYGHLRSIEFEVADPFYDTDWMILKNGTAPIHVLRQDCEITEGRNPTPEEIKNKCWLSEHHQTRYSIPYNPVEI